MKNTGLNKTLSDLSLKLTHKRIPFCVIGAIALGFYGLPRYTADIDILTEGDSFPEISKIMDKLGYQCFQKTKLFAQYDLAEGIAGKIDFMFVNTIDGKAIIKNSAFIKNEKSCTLPVIQPTDYIILKMMAIANNPDRSAKDEADISLCAALHTEKQIPKIFNDIDKEKIKLFARRFGQEELVAKYIDKTVKPPGELFKL